MRGVSKIGPSSAKNEEVLGAAMVRKRNVTSVAFHLVVGRQRVFALPALNNGVEGDWRGYDSTLFNAIFCNRKKNVLHIPRQYERHKA